MDVYNIPYSLQEDKHIHRWRIYAWLRTAVQEQQSRLIGIRATYVIRWLHRFCNKFACFNTNSLYNLQVYKSYIYYDMSPVRCNGLWKKLWDDPYLYTDASKGSISFLLDLNKRYQRPPLYRPTYSWIKLSSRRGGGWWEAAEGRR